MQILQKCLKFNKYMFLFNLKFRVVPLLTAPPPLNGLPKTINCGFPNTRQSTFTKLLSVDVKPLVRHAGLLGLQHLVLLLLLNLPLLLLLAVDDYFLSVSVGYG